MALCLHCGAELGTQARFCAQCGRPASSASEMMTADVLAAPNAGIAIAPARSRPFAVAATGFAPGAMLAGRYRIVALLGRGGMGEVYRADDLKLGHAVALKFLPPAFAQDQYLLERFHAEVRNARQVSHPNVCRVYDVGEVEGQQFLTMEFIDGEDLASLLRRIGRLPSDKALEIARQLCAGLAAAHDRGVLHRDLKPANIMLDGRGHARITDFGLAVSATGGAAEFAGTPAYMSPEQLEGKPATVQSDLYGFGLVMYETLTGKRAFEDDSIAELRRKRFISTPKLPSSIAGEIDSTFARAIERCLDKDPALRPKSATQLALSLPGGDPLAAAVAAGETPSPEMVAAAGGEEAGISPRAAAALLLAVVLSLAAIVPLARRGTVFGLTPNAKSPEALADRAQEIVQRLGYTAAPADRWWVMAIDDYYLRYRALHDSSPPRYRDLASAVPGPVWLLYRQSPESMATADPLSSDLAGTNDPAMTTPGMIYSRLDGFGHLIVFLAVPPEEDPKDRPATGVDWNVLFREAALNSKDFKPVTPTRVPPFAFDERAEWEGTWGGGPTHVYAAAYRGRPVEFDVTGPWVQPVSAPVPDRRSVVAFTSYNWVLDFGLPAIAVLLARRNLRLGRGDTKGALRLAIFVSVCGALKYLFDGGYGSSLKLMEQLRARGGVVLLSAAVVWVGYVAVEPMLRRQLPEWLISWTRLLNGGWRDARVGRDVLVGIMVGCFIAVVAYSLTALPWWFDLPGVYPKFQQGAVNNWPAFLFGTLGWAPVVSLLLIFLDTIVQRLTGRNWAAVLAGALLVGTAIFASPNLTAPFALLLTVAVLVPVLALRRSKFAGPLVLTALVMTVLLLWNVPLDLRRSTSYFPYSVATIALLVGVALFSFRCALAGRRIFAGVLED